MTQKGLGQRRVLRLPCAPHLILTHPSLATAPIPAPEPPFLMRRAYYGSNFLAQSQEFRSPLFDNICNRFDDHRNRCRICLRKPSFFYHLAYVRQLLR